MGFYARHLGPRFVRCLCCREDIAAEREKIVPRARGTVLEIGFGPGHNLPHYDAGKVEHVIGVDPNDGFLDLAAEALAKTRIPVEIRKAPAEKLPLADGSVDTAVVTYTLCSVADAARALAELRRVLKPGGEVLFLEHGLSPEDRVARWQRRLNPVWRALAVGCNLNRPVQDLLAGAGFRLREIETFYLPGPRPLTYHCRGVADRIAGS